MTNLKDKIHELSKQFHADVIAWRRHIHAHPELSKEEHQTAAFIAARLDDFGIPYQQGVAGTSIVALVKGRNPDRKSIALRADMDALPIAEENQASYKSQNPGIMHACGHDAHTAILLGAARILKELENQFQGTIKLFFQASEEQYPGGARAMIREGVLENPAVAHVIGQHVFPELEAGKVGFRSGQYMASTNEIHLTVKGKGGHAAQPALNVDPVVIAANIIVALQQIVSRQAQPDIPTVLSFGRIIGKGQTNVIPDEVKIEGTIRTFDEQWRQAAHQRITKMAKSMAEGMGGSCDVFIAPGYPALYNDPGLTQKARTWAEEFLGEENVVNLPMRMTAEDFSYFAREVPSCFYRLGVRNEKQGIISGLHTPTFDIDEKSMLSSTGLMAWIALNALLV